MIRLDAGTVLLQWATGGLLFLWVTTRRREVGVGYGWLMRGTFAALAAGSVAAGRALEPVLVRDAAAAGVALAAATALGVSVVRRRAGVAGEHERHERRAARVATMTRTAADGPADQPSVPADQPPGAVAPGHHAPGRDRAATPARGPEFPPLLDAVAPAVGAVGLVAAGMAAGGSDAVAVLRTLVGAAFLGVVTDAMLLGHWYLVQPGLARGPLLELVRWLIVLWPVEVGALLLPTGMLSALAGTVDDGYGGLLSWFWVACALATIVLAIVTRAALRERYYSAVMAATGLLYLAILTAFGTDLVARAVLA